jgi:predicted metal-dependent hydrolase
MMLQDWKAQKSAFVMAHYKWIKSVLDQMKEIKLGLKGYKYLDEAIELSTELGLNITDAEIIRTNSTGLTIYNPKNLADRIKGMKNKKVKTKAEKIAERLLYEQQSQVAN